MWNFPEFRFNIFRKVGHFFQDDVRFPEIWWVTWWHVSAKFHTTPICWFIIAPGNFLPPWQLKTTLAATKIKCQNISPRWNACNQGPTFFVEDSVKSYLSQVFWREIFGRLFEHKMKRLLFLGVWSREYGKYDSSWGSGLLEQFAHGEYRRSVPLLTSTKDRVWIMNKRYNFRQTKI